MSSVFTERSAENSSICKKVLPGIFLGYEGDILIADLEDLEKLDGSDVYPPRIKAKEVMISQKMMNSHSQ